MAIDTNTLSSLAKMSGGTVNDKGEIVVPDMTIMEKDGLPDNSALSPEEIAAAAEAKVKLEAGNGSTGEGSSIPEKTPEELAAETEKVRVADESWATNFKERTGTEWKPELVDKIKAEPQQQSTTPEYKTEFSRLLDEWVEQGGDAEEFIAVNSLDFEKDMKAEDQIAFDLQRKNPEYDDEMIKDTISLKYKMDTWPEDPKDDTPETKLLRRQFELDSKTAKIDNKKYQQEWLAPRASENKKRQEESFQKQQEFATEWEGSVKEHLKDYSKETFTLGKDNEFSIDVKDKAKVEKDMIAAATKPYEYLQSRYLDSEGVTDYAKMRRDMFVLDNLPAILKTAAEDAAAKAIKDHAKGIKNTTDTRTGQQAGTDATKSAGRQVYEQLKDKI